MAFVFEKRSEFHCSQKMLYDFHLDVKNLQAITQRGVEVKLLDDDFVPFEGGVLRLRVVKNFVPMVWEVKIECMDEPRLLLDVALRSPFASWRHSHIFRQIDETRCELRDVVEYELPFGAIGRLFRPFVACELERMFDYRHQKTKELLESKVATSL